MEMTTISSKEYRDLVERAYSYGFYADRAEELENELLEIKGKLADYAVIDEWLTANPYYAERLTEWKAAHGLDSQAAEIERLNGENEELRRAIDELGAQVEYWRLKAGVDHEQ